MPTQNPFPVFGTVTLATKGYGSTAVAQEGCRIWIKDLTEGTTRISYWGGSTKENVYITQTNSNGDYILELSDLTSAYANNDTVRVYCEFDNKITWRDFTLSVQTGLQKVDFTLSKHSGLIDGCRSTVDKTDRSKGGLQHLGTGMRPGVLKGFRGEQVGS